jgi:hypothetical protein
VNDKQKSQYFVSATGWLCGCILSCLLLPLLEAPLSFLFTKQNAHHFQPVFWQYARVIVYLQAAALGGLTIRSLVKFKQLDQKIDPRPDSLPMIGFYLCSQRPLVATGALVIAVLSVVYWIKQGFDSRHAYVIGIAVGGFLFMSLIATIGFALLARGSAAQSSAKTTGKRFPTWSMLLQALGCAALLLLVSLSIAWCIE